jgi:hypothetical protein
MKSRVEKGMSGPILLLEEVFRTEGLPEFTFALHRTTMKFCSIFDGRESPSFWKDNLALEKQRASGE